MALTLSPAASYIPQVTITLSVRCTSMVSITFRPVIGWMPPRARSTTGYRVCHWLSCRGWRASAGNAAAWISWVAGLALLVIARVHPLIVDNRPTRRLLDEWGNAQLVVVGGRGRGGIHGMLLGSVSAALVHRAPIPVTVARQQHNSVPPHAETTTAE